MIIAGGENLIDKINRSKNTLIPLDSEHFSLINTKINDNELAHPKWKMGYNNSIDSSNFINKILEIYELSILFKINLNKIDFLINQEAYIHSIVISKQNIVSINCFDNDMLYTLVNPLLNYFPKLKLETKPTFLKNEMFKIQKFNDKRFKIYKFLNILKGLTPDKQIRFMILNNLAQKKYLSKEIRYNEILNFIMNNLNITSKSVKFKTLYDRLKFIDIISSKYDKKS